MSCTTQRIASHTCMQHYTYYSTARLPEWAQQPIKHDCRHQASHHTLLGRHAKADVCCRPAALPTRGTRCPSQTGHNHSRAAYSIGIHPFSQSIHPCRVIIISRPGHCTITVRPSAQTPSWNTNRRNVWTKPHCHTRQCMCGKGHQQRQQPPANECAGVCYPAGPGIGFRSQDNRLCRFEESSTTSTPHSALRACAGLRCRTARMQPGVTTYGDALKQSPPARPPTLAWPAMPHRP